QRFFYNTSKSLTQDSSKNSTIQLDPSTVYSSNEPMEYDKPMEYYKESNEYSFENNISYYNESAIYSSEELNEDKDSCEFISETSSINSYNKLSNDSLSENEFFDDIADKALDSDKLLQNIDDFLPYFENTTTALIFCWIQKNSIATNAYNELVEILHYPNSILIMWLKIFGPLDDGDKDFLLCQYTQDLLHMYFGPGQEVTCKSEYWYGNL
ncbi:28808_t:CDS:2, partial [Dentiscutata erythropus]